MSTIASALTDLANPGRFMRLSERLLPALFGLGALGIGIGLGWGFFVAPEDYQQGDTVRIMYLHVPAAWLGMAMYAMMAISALGTLVWRHPLADVAQRAAAPIGPCSRWSASSPARSGASRCGAPTGSGMRA